MLVKDMEVHFYDEVFVVKPEKETEGTPATTTNSLVEEQKEVVRQFFLRNSAGDIPGAISLFRGDATYWLPTTRERLGMDKLPEALKMVQSRLKGGIRYEVGTMVAEPNKIAVQLEGFAKTSRGPRTTIFTTSTSSSRATRSCAFMGTTTRPTSSTRCAQGSADRQDEWALILS